MVATKTFAVSRSAHAKPATASGATLVFLGMSPEPVTVKVEIFVVVCVALAAIATAHDGAALAMVDVVSIVAIIAAAIMLEAKYILDFIVISPRGCDI